MKSLIGFLGATLLASTAHAIIYFNAQEVEGDIVVTGSGSINLAGAATAGSAEYSLAALLWPSQGTLVVGPATLFDYYTPISGSSFGTGGFHGNPIGTGDHFGVWLDQGWLIVPVGYVSGAPLEGSTTFANTTFASAGMTEGVYTWTFGSGANVDSLVLTVGNGGAPAVPEPATFALLGGLAAVGLAAWRRRRA